MKKSIATNLIILLILFFTWTPIEGPIQVISYLTPIIAVFIALVLGVATVKFETAILISAFLTIGFFSAAFHSDTGFLNPLLGLLTFSPLLILCLRFPFAEKARLAFLRATVLFSIAETIIAIYQFLTLQHSFVFTRLSAGDVAYGSLGTNSHLFAVKMLFQGLLLFYAWDQTKKVPIKGMNPNLLLFGMTTAFISAVIASAILATAIFFGSVVIWYILSNLSKLRLKRGMVTFLIFVLLASSVFLTTQIGNAKLVYNNIIYLAEGGLISGSNRYQKITVFIESIQEVLLENPKNLLIGTGMGRYSSRAAMMLSGGYLSPHPTWFPISRSQETETHIYRRWNPSTWKSYGGSIMGMPTSSHQSVVIEFGVIGSIILFLCFILILYEASKKKISQINNLQAIYLQAIPPFIIAFFMINISDLWLEYPQISAYVYLVIVLGLSKNKTLEL